MKIAKYQTSKSVTLISLVSMKKLKKFFDRPLDKYIFL